MVQQQIINNLESDMFRINNWMNNNLLCLNDDKSTFMIVAKSNIIESFRDQCILQDGKPIEGVTRTRILEV
jgi:hypothetical protein